MSRYGDVPLFWVLFWGCSRIFGYLFGLFPDFWVSFFGYSRIFRYHVMIANWKFQREVNCQRRTKIVSIIKCSRGGGGGG